MRELIAEQRPPSRFPEPGYERGVLMLVLVGRDIAANYVALLAEAGAGDPEMGVAPATARLHASCLGTCRQHRDHSPAPIGGP